MSDIPEPTMKRMICRPNHTHRGKVCKVGEIIEDTPHYIRLLESQNVTVPPGYENLFQNALDENEGDHMAAMNAVKEQQIEDEAAKQAAELDQPEPVLETPEKE